MGVRSRVVTVGPTLGRVNRFALATDKHVCAYVITIWPPGHRSISTPSINMVWAYFDIYSSPIVTVIIQLPSTICNSNEAAKKPMDHSTEAILNARWIEIIFGLKLGTTSKLRQARPYNKRQDGPICSRRRTKATQRASLYRPAMPSRIYSKKEGCLEKNRDAAL